MLLVPVALAAPLAPAAAQSVPVGVEVAAFVTTGRSMLTVQDCALDEGCTAVRNELVRGGEIDLRVVERVGVYVQVGQLVENTGAATFYGTGTSLAGGAKAGFELPGNFGVDLWAGGLVRAATDPSPADGASADTTRRVELEGGASARWGSSSEGFMAWIGADATPISSDRSSVLDGTLQVLLRPTVPVSAVGGIFAVSDPLGGPWTRRGRVGAGVSAALGYRNQVTGWITAAL